MLRTKLSQRTLPRYSRGEEIMNMLTHVAGGVFAMAALVLCLLKAKSPPALFGAAVYGASMLILYVISSVYHGLKPTTAKKVFQVLDHCAVYVLIAGTYTPILLVKFVPAAPAVGWGLLTAQWGLCALSMTLTAIDLKRFRVISMIAYILMGWCIIFFLPLTLSILGQPAFMLLLWGGIAYTLGAIIYGIGVHVPWMHSVFHLFVLAGSVFQFLSVYLYVL